MENKMENITIENITFKNAYVNYNGRVQIGAYIIIVGLWNAYVEKGGEGIKVYPNNKEFFANSFDNAYDAAQAASAGDYQWSDLFVYFDADGNLMSFTILDDDTCPIDVKKIDISSLIRELIELENKDLENQE